MQKKKQFIHVTELIVFIVYFLFMLGSGVFFFFKSKDVGEKEMLWAGRLVVVIAIIAVIIAAIVVSLCSKEPSNDVKALFARASVPEK